MLDWFAIICAAGCPPAVHQRWPSAALCVLLNVVLEGQQSRSRLRHPMVRPASEVEVGHSARVFILQI